ncbi:MAG: beta-lactamase family protein [Parvibaculaceae bacterium]|nr:beta-lactamase family protein [Parvibaculaceae bacterium]
MEKISRTVKDGTVNGFVAPGFEGVVDAFAKNFDARDEVGASVCLSVEGETVVDLWGGTRNSEGAAWEEDTVSIVFSCTKGATALCAHMLADQGKLDLNAPVSKYWPEFACNGKENATVAMMLDHSVGVPHVRPQIKDGGYCDWDYMADLVAKEEAFWEPGTRNGYHGVTFAWTVGEIVRRVSGKSLGQFFREEVAGPLGLDFHIGLPESEEGRVADMIQAVPGPDMQMTRFMEAVMSDPASPSSLFLLNGGNADFNSREMHAAEIGSANGITNARGLAGMYAPLANDGAHNDVRMMSANGIARMSTVSMATHDDATLLIPSRFSLGYMKSMDNRHLPVSDGSSCIIGADAFGHVGMGGHFGFADPSASMSFGYTMNKMGLGILLNDRGQSLVDAAYEAVGYVSNEGGVWIR